MEQIGSAANKALGLIDAMTENDPPPKLEILQGGATDIATFRKRLDNRWEGRYSESGKQISVYADTKKNCVELVKQRQKEKEPQKSNDITLSRWIEKWLQVYKIPKLKPNSIASITQTLNKYVLPKLGNVPLTELDPLTIQELINNITSLRQKEITARNLNNALSKAYKLRLIPDNPVTAVEFDKAKADSWHALTKEEEKRLITALEHSNIKQLVLFYLYSGLRRNEAIALLWSDIDYENNVIYVNKSLDNKNEPSTTKNGEARTVPLFDSLKRILEEIPHKNERIFPVSAAYVQKYFKKLTVSLGFNHIVIHSLRHTFATRCLEAGVNIKVLSSWLGHKTLKLTSDLYVHVQDELSKQEAEKVDKLFEK